jgi:hypothetical protein
LSSAKAGTAKSAIKIKAIFETFILTPSLVIQDHPVVLS